MRRQIARESDSFIRTVILVTGDSCSGKTTLIQAITQDHAIKNVNMDNFVLYWGLRISPNREIRQLSQLIDDEHSQTFVEEFIRTLDIPEKVIFLEGHILRYKSVCDQLASKLKREGYRVWKMARS